MFFITLLTLTSRLLSVVMWSQSNEDATNLDDGWKMHKLRRGVNEVNGCCADKDWSKLCINFPRGSTIFWTQSCSFKAVRWPIALEWPFSLSSWPIPL